MRYYALQHGHFSDPYSVRVALDGTAEPRYKDQGSGLCRAGWLLPGWVARPRVGGTGPTRAAPPRTGPYERNRAERNQRATARRNANGSRNRAAWRPPGPRAPSRPPGGRDNYRHPEFENGKARKVRSRNTASAGRRRVYTGEKCSFCAKVALRTLCLCVAGSTVLRTPLGPPSPVYSMPNIEHAMPAGAFVESCVSAFARRSSVGG